MFRQVLLEDRSKLHEKRSVHHLVDLAELLSRLVETKIYSVLLPPVTKS